MSKREEYSLVFQKIPVHGTTIILNNCHSTDPDFLALSFLSYCDAHVSSYIKEQIENAEANTYFHTDLQSDTLDHVDIRIIPPNAVVDGLSVPLSDMKALLDEWIEFCRLSEES